MLRQWRFGFGCMLGLLYIISVHLTPVFGSGFSLARRVAFYAIRFQRASAKHTLPSLIPHGFMRKKDAEVKRKNAKLEAVTRAANANNGLFEKAIVRARSASKSLSHEAVSWLLEALWLRQTGQGGTWSNCLTRAF